MRSIRGSVGDISKGRYLRGEVIDTVGKYCSIRLAKNGVVIKGIPLAGGPIAAGNECIVDYSSGNPVALAVGEAPVTAAQQTPVSTKAVMSETRDPTEIANYDTTSSISILLYDGAEFLMSFEASGSGFESALDNIGLSGYIVLPPLDVTGDFTAYSETRLFAPYGRFRIMGSLELLGDAVLENITINRNINTSGDVYALEVSGDDDEVILKDCVITCYNAGSGAGYAIGITDDNTVVEVRDCTLDSDEEVLYFTSSGSAYVYDSKITSSLLTNQSLQVLGDKKQAMFTVEGDIPVDSIPLRLTNLTGEKRFITQVHLRVYEPPTGASLIVDINNNGTTIFTNQDHRATIVAGAYSGYTTTIDLPIWGAYDELTADIDQVGSGEAGSNLVITIVYI